MLRPEIYLLTNTVNGKRYVGVTSKGVLARWKQHCYTAKCKAVTYLHRAINKYGKESFTVEHIASALNPTVAVEFERDVIKQYAPEYNQTNGGEFTVGRRVTEETRRKMAEGQKGRKHSAERRQQHGEAIKQKLKDDPVYRNKIFDALDKARANAFTPAANAKRGAAAIGRPMSLEARKKISDAHIGMRHTQEVIDKISEKHRKPVECITLNTTFDSVLEAAEATGVYFSNISEVCRGKRKRAGGLVFKFV